MGDLKAVELIAFCEANYDDISIIGVVNPSVVIRFNGKGYVVYRLQGQKQGRYVLVLGEDRVYFDNPEKLKRLIK